MAERVEGTNKGLAAKLIQGAIRKRLGIVPKAKTLAAHHAPTLMATTWMDAIVAGARLVPQNLKELAQLKVAMMAGCPF